MLQAKAAYEQLLALQSYEVTLAETDGIITARDVDPGTLMLQVTTPGSSIPIVDPATLHPLRVYADVPQDLAAFIKHVQPASVSATKYSDRVGRVHGHVNGRVTRSCITEVLAIAVAKVTTIEGLDPGWPIAAMAPALMPKDAHGVPFDPFAIHGGNHWYTVGAQRLRALRNDLADRTFRPGWLRSVRSGWVNWALKSFMECCGPG